MRKNQEMQFQNLKKDIKNPNRHLKSKGLKELLKFEMHNIINAGNLCIGFI